MIDALDRGQQQAAQFLHYLLISQGLSPLFGHDHQILAGQPRPVATEKFPQPALHAVAPGGLAEAPGHHQPEAGAGGLRGRQGDPEMARVYPFPLGLDPEIFRATAEPIHLSETGGPWDGGVRDGGGAAVDGIRGKTQEHSNTTKPSGVSGRAPGGV